MCTTCNSPTGRTLTEIKESTAAGLTGSADSVVFPADVNRQAAIGTGMQVEQNGATTDLAVFNIAAAAVTRIQQHRN